MEKTGSLALVLLWLFVAGLQSSENVAVAYLWARVPAIFAFGESKLVSAGTNEFMFEVSIRLPDCVPYSETFSHRNTGRLSNGYPSLDIIASRVGLPFVQPFLQPGVPFEKAVNFASGGSGVLSTRGDGGGVILLTNLLSRSQQAGTKLTSDLGAAAAGNLISTSIPFLAIRINDLSITFRSYALQQTTMYSARVRKVTILFSIGPLRCAPRIMASENGTNGICGDAAINLVRVHSYASMNVRP